jgi:hypothetical protein
MNSATLPFSPSNVSRNLALGAVGSAAFGSAAGLGHGAFYTLRGAWMAPCLFVGGALLAVPPLYLASTWAASERSAEEVLGDVSAVLHKAGVMLLGLAAPAAFFSATLRTHTAWALLCVSCVSVGAASVVALSRRTFKTPSMQSVLWILFAYAIGIRLLLTLFQQLTH